MLDDSLRAIKERVLTPIADRAGRYLHPNAVTLAGLGFGLAAAVCAAGSAYIAGLLCWGVNRVLDGLDGTIARRHAKQSDLGGYLDTLADFLVYALVPLGLAYGVADRPVWMACAVLIAAFYVNAASWLALSAILEKRNLAGHKIQTTVIIPGGLIEGAETVLFYTLFFLLPSALSGLFGLMATLVGVTVVQRLLWAGRHLSEKADE